MALLNSMRSLLALVVLSALLCACMAVPVTAPVRQTPTLEATQTPEQTPTSRLKRAASPTPAVVSAKIRPATVAGTWYPDDPDQLAKMVDGLLAATSPLEGAPISLIVPHAGYVFSGPVAATGFIQLAGHDYEVAVIIASDHQPPLSKPISVWAEGGFETPLGVVPVASELAEALLVTSPLITRDEASHEGEHPIEIQLPFLQRVCPDCLILPILMGSESEEAIQALVDGLVEVLADRRAVIIASSDLSHYPAYRTAVTVDGATLGAIESGEASQVKETIAAVMAQEIPNLATCACGLAPILVAMQTAALLGADTTTVLRYANSGDSPFGNRDQVVGYGAVMFWHYDPLQLTSVRRAELLKLARASIVNHIQEGALTGEITPETEDSELLRKSGAYVTLKKDGELRGCVGHVWMDKPLYQVVQEMAIAAATADPRFLPLTLEELDQVTIEISILSPLQRITDRDQIQIGRHGLMILKDGHSGLLLPQVAMQEGWQKEEYLDHLCLKAELPADCWAEEATLYTFTAQVFGED